MPKARLITPLNEATVGNLRIGQRVLLSGVIYMAGEEAQRKMARSLEQGEEIPFSVVDQVLFYATFTPPKPGRLCGSAGLLTGEQLDLYIPRLIARGLKGIIGVGRRSYNVIKAMQEHKAVYFAAVSGASALIASTVKSYRIVAYPDLGDEAVCELVVEDLPLIVANDVMGGDLYQEGTRMYAQVIRC